MLCQRCRTHLLSRLPSQHTPSLRSKCPSFISSTRRFYSAPAPAHPSKAMPAIEIPNTATPGTASETGKLAAMLSSVPAGTPLKGLNYMKSKPDIVAKEDTEYPDWLWTLVGGDKGAGAKKKSGEIDLSTLNKKQRKRAEKKMAARTAVATKKIPLHEQTIDITPAEATADVSADDVSIATASVEARAEITKSAREARRKSIRESNFLRGL
ncbi:hypothetical protein AJ80_07656 [Polytolypa hystricis UAMH7299]|uniref:Large ribosomal subunit protein mL54 n=1 Tax=Polytolypa hystricis (strain UAMH7299) TaxID=1447883 RepID=A0A2B7XM35_POLH7|nr:hypothetical protein AJ80_07656 [Polytolypa hystricis UAMH7299]